MTVSFVGSGNVASHMARAFFNAGFDMLEICSRNLDHATELAERIHASALTEVEQMLPADLLIISVKDDAIEEVVHKLPGHFGLVVHTSGAIPLQSLSKFDRSGVLYPLQTFSKSRDIDFKEVPVCVEGSHD
ncbi:MAG: DUF2520 domain-containing protein, partial [Chitinophagaceae bacterium]